MTRKKSQTPAKSVRKMHPNSLKNLQPFAKGDDPRRNAGGVPKDVQELNAKLDELFAEEVTDEKGKKMQKLMFALNRMLLGRNIAGAIHLLERRYGKIPQPMTLEGDKDKPFYIVIDHEDTDIPK